MIHTIRRLRRKFAAIPSAWMPPQEVTLLSLRVWPWELDAAGQPKAAFRTNLSSLAAEGWRSDSGHVDLPALDRPRLRSFSSHVRLRAGGRLLIATQLSGYGKNELILSHLITTPEGHAVATMTTALPLAKAGSPSGGVDLVPHGASAPATAKERLARAA